MKWLAFYFSSEYVGLGFFALEWRQHLFRVWSHWISPLSVTSWYILGWELIWWEWFRSGYRIFSSEEGLQPTHSSQFGFFFFLKCLLRSPSCYAMRMLCTAHTEQSVCCQNIFAVSFHCNRKKGDWGAGRRTSNPGEPWSSFVWYHDFRLRL